MGSQKTSRRYGSEDLWRLKRERGMLRVAMLLNLLRGKSLGIPFTKGGETAGKEFKDNLLRELKNRFDG